MSFSKEEKISIIVPVYKVEKYLPRCVESIINQTYKNLEIILVDDGSPDNCGKLCDEYAQKDERIKVIHKPNGGLSAARNSGINISTGDYIAFIDSDDWISEDYCETLYHGIVDTNSDISIIDYNVVNEEDKITNPVDANSENTGLTSITYENENIIKELLLQKNIKNFVWRMLYRKNVICNFLEGVNYEDMFFTLQVLMNVQKVVYTKKRCYNYLQRGGSITATISEKNLTDFIKAVKNRFEIISKSYSELTAYNVYALFESTVGLSTKYIIAETQYENVNEVIQEFINTIMKHEEEIISLLNDYQKLCLYLMKYNLDLYYNFLKERQTLRIQGKI